MSDLISSDSPISDDDKQALQIIAGILIPASDEYAVPGADDQDIFNNVIALALESSQAAAGLKTGFDAIQELAHKRHDAGITELDKADLTSLLQDSASSRFLQTMIRYTANAYYQDGRVLKSLNLKSEPPFPGGYEVEQGDWSLLDPVKQRAPFYKKV